MNSGPLHLAHIDLTAFRGVERTLGLDFGRRLTIIYGGNATGKSSIAQAIEFAISGQVRDLEDGLIPAAFLANTRRSTSGRVSLKLDDGTTLNGVTDRPRSEIERRFREIGAVDWPDRQPLPITTTHVTTQGMLAKVLGNENAVTRNDLSGLCAGAYLRFMVSRAQRLADHFRQASSGRNIQAELRDASAAYDTAKLLVDSLRATSQGVDVPAADIQTRLATLASRLALGDAPSVDSVLASLETQSLEIEGRLRAIQSLLSRTRELGQAESELTELSRQLADTQSAESALVESRNAANARLLTVADRLKDQAAQRARWLDDIAAFEQQQQLAANVSSIDARRREVLGTQESASHELRLATVELDGARQDLATRTSARAGLRQARDRAVVQAQALQGAAVAIEQLPPERDVLAEQALDDLERQLAQLESESRTLNEALEEARQLEASSSERLSRVSESGQRCLAAISAMHSFARDGHCPLCGHDHGSLQSLEDEIRQVSEAVMEGAELLRPQFEAAVAERREREARAAAISARIADTRTKVASARDASARRSSRRREALDSIERLLAQAGLDIAIEAEAISRARAEVASRLAQVDDEIRVATDAEAEAEARLVGLEQTTAAKVARVDQLTRLAAELATQIEKFKSTRPTNVPAIDPVQLRATLAESESMIRGLDLEHGQAESALADTDRRIADRRAEIAGIERRRQTVAAFLNNVDAEFTGIGLQRDVVALVDAERQAAKRRAGLAELKVTAAEIAQQQRALEEGRALVAARDRLRAAEQALKSAQGRQQRLQVRNAEFKDLHEKLEALQNDTAESVLENIRGPVNVLFHAMTAGCPWDIQFRLETGKLGAVLTDGSTRDVSAMSVLNSAYVNVAAIALRLALASQQRWTRLRSVVLDDPILEMDHLTQSALIDGFEAILASTAAPWRDLQFVLTTWSEDFAVMAAHKLAHLNHAGESGAESTVDQFIIHRLSSDLDGTTVSQRHVPRWRRAAAAA